MSFDSFINAINEKITSSGEKIKATFSNDEEKGLFRAEFDDGMVFTAPRGGKTVTANWGAGHQAQFCV